MLSSEVVILYDNARSHVAVVQAAVENWFHNQHQSFIMPVTIGPIVSIYKMTLSSPGVSNPNDSVGHFGRTL
ncbi:hypothetical protein TNCV_4122811 [Trichonephila clavipes]|nr:hypothetical protein TNCV_4122811 [Trichonephila clavipes]